MAKMFSRFSPKLVFPIDLGVVATPDVENDILTLGGTL